MKYIINSANNNKNMEKKYKVSYFLYKFIVQKGINRHQEANIIKQGQTLTRK